MRRRSPSLALLAALVGLTWVTAAQGDEIEPRASRVAIHLGGVTGPQVTKKAWDAACKALGRAMLSSGGIWGFGIFDAFQCHDQGAPQPGLARVGAWAIRLAGDTEVTRITVEITALARQGSGGDAADAVVSVPLASIEIPRDPRRVARTLRKRDAARLLAGALLDSLPGAWKLRAGTVAEATRGSLSARLPKPGTPAPPQTLRIFRLYFDPQEAAWRASVLGEARLEAPPSSRGQRRRLRWTLERPLAPLPPKSLVWAHNAEGPGKRRDELLASFTALMPQKAKPAADAEREEESLDEPEEREPPPLFGFDATFLSLRYGWSLLPSQLFERMSIFGLLLTLGGGPLSGLSLSCDLWPEATGSALGAKASFKGQRFILGYSLSLELLGPALSVDVTPTLGMWSFDVRIPVDRGDGVAEVAPFKTDKALGAGIELGIESAGTWHVARGWHSRGLAISLGGAIDSSNVSAVRTGADLFLKVHASSSFEVALLLFAFDETIRIQREVKPGVSTPTLSFIEFNQVYAGSGVSLLW